MPLFAIATACSFSSPEATTDTLIEAQCKFIYGCCNPYERQGTSSHDSQAECVAESKKSDDVTEQLQASAAAGRIDWNAQQAAACFQPVLDAVNQCDAGAFFEARSQADCDVTALVVGKIPDGEPCYEDYECATPNSSCTREENEEETGQVVTFLGKCVPPKKAGEGCSFGDACEEGTYCSGSVCTLYAKVGESCANQVCVEGATCTADDICTILKAAGEACTSDSECTSGDCEQPPSNFEGDSVCASDPEDGDLPADDVTYEICTGKPLGT